MSLITQLRFTSLFIMSPILPINWLSSSISNPVIIYNSWMTLYKQFNKNRSTKLVKTIT